MIAAIAAPIVTFAIVVGLPMQQSQRIASLCLPASPYNQAKMDAYRACYYKHGGIGSVTLSQGTKSWKTVGGTVVSETNLTVYR